MKVEVIKERTVAAQVSITIPIGKGLLYTLAVEDHANTEMAKKAMEEIARAYNDRALLRNAMADLATYFNGAIRSRIEQLVQQTKEIE
jgi:hypothetical protein